MRSKRMRLDRFLTTQAHISPSQVRPTIARGSVRVDGAMATGISQVVDHFSRIELDGKILQAREPVYFMLHKPCGVVSATRDGKHQTVIDLLAKKDREQLHIAGRLDYNTTGLVLLTNDGGWSRSLSEPGRNVAKTYQVCLENPLTPHYIQAFAEGMYFPYEDSTTRPAELRIISDYLAEVRLTEGKYHQIKRMFGRFQNRVLALHRSAIGNLVLDPALAAGKYRALTGQEISDI